ncbi:uncharacterized protein Z519_06971 [Cladophialophora bantiana CBS 173.52]|uniref:Uncharacterized protein n=1 Tax=Cladophialophora bantiana (strain ATCC 10958 / CBS 173.52 / CDC B-1940 / NIH 8579) TaxID=1442370 RepID=A0A0D2I561_CLAB1|nr:uncharacterized protein Z519_06971 [Cladophialophora bantiana CBS 173.52]KIW91989.1 hypothetical protein Z519_06971 [Cladophialophora bantiana CBS 173.52]
MASSIFYPFLSPSLSALLFHLPSSTPLDTLSRTSPSRLQRTALPNIGLIDLVSATDFSTLYDPLYIHSFPRLAERERSDLIVDRLAAQAKGDRKGLAPYRIVGIRDHQGEAIGAAQFSVLPVPPRKGRNSTTGSADCGDDDGLPEGSKYAVPYLQYIYVRRQNRRQDMSEVLHTMVLAVAAADAALMDMEDAISSSGVDPLLRAVPFTLFETEPPDHGDDHASRAYALERSKIHTSTGGMALVLRRRRPRPSSQDSTRPKQQEQSATAEGEDDEILSAHVQPGLEPSDPPLTLVWILRPAPTATLGQDYDLTSLGKALVAAYYQSLRDEGFPEKNIRLAERIVQERCRGSVFQLMPLGDVRDFRPDKGNLDI